jgi:hypothetical protein
MSKIVNQLKQLSTLGSQPPSPQKWFFPFDFRLSTFGLLLIFNFSLLTLQACGLDVEDPIPPSPPQWVEKSLPEEWPERGIDAHQAVGIYLEWKDNPYENIDAYEIWRAEYFDAEDSLGMFEILTWLEVESISGFRFLDQQIELRTEYYYKTRAQSVTGNNSDFSDSISYKLLPQLPILNLIPNGSSEELTIDRKLSWRYEYAIEMEDYCLTVITADNQLVCRELMSPNGYVGGTEAWNIPDTITLISDQIYKWRIDTGAEYVEGLETAGSESAWATFFYLEQ